MGIHFFLILVLYFESWGVANVTRMECIITGGGGVY